MEYFWLSAVLAVAYIITANAIRRFIDGQKDEIEFTVKYKGKDVHLPEDDQREIWAIITKSMQNHANKNNR